MGATRKYKSSVTMATRSTISYILQTTGEVLKVYCHFDGYIEGVGTMLFNYYNSYEKIAKLIDYGGISSLQENELLCEFYHRDRREPLQISRFPSETDYKIFCAMEEYNYLYDWTAEEWFVSRNSTNTWRPLKIYFNEE